MNKAYLFLRSRARWVLLIGAACFACYLAATAGMRARTIPAPPWADRGGEPTNAVEILNYLDAVMAYLPDSTIDELFAAQSSGATETELQSIIYRERVAAVRLEDQIIDYNNLGSLTNTLRWAHLAAMLRQVLRTIELYESQWELTTGGATNWESSLSQLLHGLRLLDQLKRRVDDPGDPLDKLEQYAAILPLPGFSRVVYNWAVDMLLNNLHDRAEPLFLFLLGEANPDGFVLGGSHYWTGVILKCRRRDYANALDHLLRVHEYPTCLVHTDSSYREASDIFRRQGKMDIAQALCAVHVPSIDYWKGEVVKAHLSFRISLAQGDPTNALRQILRARTALRNKPGIRGVSIGLWERFYRQAFPHVDTHALGNVLSDETIELQEVSAIQKAFHGPDRAGSNPAVANMLLHAWPLIEDVDPSILTNRVISNNIFEYQQRQIH